ncbi:MAG: ABC transporter permease, partial [Candidatus Acidiferrum sp.]
MSNLGINVRHTLRQLHQRPAFSALTVLTLALGIGATTAIFSVVYGVLLRPLPYPQADRIVHLWELDATGNRMNVAEPNFTDLRAASKTFIGLTAVSSEETTVTGGSEPTRVTGAAVSRDFFTVFGVSPILGRAFSAEDQRPGAAPAALVSHAYWQQYLRSSPNLAKFKLLADNQVFSVVGVMPQGFNFPDNTALWVPSEIFPSDTSRTAHNW